MICEQCREHGLKSKVFPGMTFVTAMSWQAYYDEEGQYVNNDPNIHTTDYRCSNRHRWVVKDQHKAQTVEYLEPEPPPPPVPDVGPTLSFLTGSQLVAGQGLVYDGNGNWEVRALAADETGPDRSSAAQ